MNHLREEGGERNEKNHYTSSYLPPKQGDKRGSFLLNWSELA